MIHFYLRPTHKQNDGLIAFKKIIDYLLTFVGDIEVKKENVNNLIIYYIGTPSVAFLKLEKTGQITVTISPEDNVTISLINNISKNIGLRIYNPQIQSYLLNDTNLLDLTNIKLDLKVKNILIRYQLIPLFQYRDSLIFFCMAIDKSIHLVNRHLLEYLLSNPNKKKFTKEFSVKVASNISQFVALFDRGLINLNFQNNLNGNPKVINLSGFNLKKLPKDTKLQVINFKFDEENQSFTQIDTSSKIPKKYLAVKIGQDYTYKIVNGKLLKLLNVSVYN